MDEKPIAAPIICNFGMSKIEKIKFDARARPELIMKILVFLIDCSAGPNMFETMKMEFINKIIIIGQVAGRYSLFERKRRMDGEIAAINNAIGK